MRTAAPIIILFVALTATADTGRLDLVRDGRAVATIVTPADPPQWTATAANWLQQYARKVSGAELSIASENQSPTGTLISIGHTKLAQQAGVDLDGLKWDGCRLVVKDKVLYLIGLDNAGTKTHDWVGARGTCRAVIKLLEDHCGIRWFLPGPQGEQVPQIGNISVPADLDVRFQPDFVYSDGRSVYDENILNEPGRTLAAQANNYRKAVKASPGGHTYYGAISQQTYGKEHPEYYALIGGKRRNADWTPQSPYGHHLCSTNPDVKRLLIEYVRKRFDQGLDWQSLGQEDGYLRCQCDNCEKLDQYRDAPTGVRWEVFQNSTLRDAPPERLFMLHKAVIDEVHKTHPDKMMMLMCYAPTAWPSKKIDYFGDHVIGELMNLHPTYIEAWRNKVAGLTGFTYWHNTQCPMGLNVHMTAKETADRIKYLHENKFVALSVGPEATWGLEGPTFYMMGRLFGDASLDHKAVIKEYCDGVFGKASPAMLEFFALLETRLEQVVPIADDDIAANARNTQLPHWLTTPQMFLAMYPPNVLEKLESSIEQAEAAADTERNRGWVRLSRDQFDFIKLLTHMLIAYRVWQVSKTPENWQELKQTVTVFEDWREKIVSYPKSYTDQWWPGHDIFGKWLVGNLEDTGTAFYCAWEKRKADVLSKGLRGRAMGYGQSYYYSFIKEPLTLDFSKQP